MYADQFSLEVHSKLPMTDIFFKKISLLLHVAVQI